MWVRADRVAIEGAHGPLVQATSLTVHTGELAIVHGEPGPGVSAFGLALAGRLRPSSGTVTGHDIDDGANLRDVAAIVDAPGINEPDDALALRIVVGEELALGNHPARGPDVTRWLADNDLAGQAQQRFENIEPATRTRLLTQFAAQRPGVRLLVLDRPDRHTSEVVDWVELAREYARRGFAVIVLAATAAQQHMPTTPAEFGAHEQPAPLRCRVDEPDEVTEDQELP